MYKGEENEEKCSQLMLFSRSVIARKISSGISLRTKKSQKNNPNYSDYSHKMSQ